MTGQSIGVHSLWWWTADVCTVALTAGTGSQGVLTDTSSWLGHTLDPRCSSTTLVCFKTCALICIQGGDTALHHPDCESELRPTLLENGTPQLDQSPQQGTAATVGIGVSGEDSSRVLVTKVPVQNCTPFATDFWGPRCSALCRYVTVCWSADPATTKFGDTRLE